MCEQVGTSKVSAVMCKKRLSKNKRCKEQMSITMLSFNSDEKGILSVRHNGGSGLVSQMAHPLFKLFSAATDSSLSRFYTDGMHFL